MHEIKLPLDEFSRELLEPANQELTGVEFRKAVQSYFETQLLGSVGAAEVIVTESSILLKWTSEPNGQTLTERGVDYLSRGDYERGVLTLQIALRKAPESSVVLYNLGMALSDMGRLDEAISFLDKLTNLEPKNARAWVALGVAYGRKREAKQATASLQRAVDIDPNDPYALKNLGAMIAASSDDLETAEKHLRKAASMMENDPQIWVNLAKLYEASENWEAADEAYTKILDINPHGQYAELAGKGRSKIAELNFRAKGELRPDALMYCVSAIKLFNDLPLEEVQKITFEIAILGMNGLDVNSPEKKYSTQSLEGKYSGLNLLCIEYVGFMRLDGSVDLGFDLSKEYKAALEMANQ